MKGIKTLILCLSVAVLAAVPVLAQSSTDTNMEILRDKVKADKKLVVAANLNLTEAEGKAFWPVYEAYQKELQAINERVKKTVMAYADGYTKNTMTDAQAMQLSNDALAIDQDEINLRKSYASKLAGVVPGKKAARYLQIENKLRAVIRYELAAGIPLVE
jgi:hypothetical protein